METTFFTSVAKHDLERFHSECLAWLFNSDTEHKHKYAVEFIKKIEHKYALEFNKKIDNHSEDIQFLNAFTEVQQLDLVLYYKSDGKNKAIIIENKVKASEGRKKLATGLRSGKPDKEWVYINDNYKKHVDVKNEYFDFSQTEYDHLRPNIFLGNDKVDTSKSVSSEEESVNKVLAVSKSECKWVFLIPAKVDLNIIKNFKVDGYEANDWNKVLFGRNPWLTYSYCQLHHDLIELIENSGGVEPNEILRKAYFEHIDIKFNKYEKDLNNQFYKYSPSTFGAFEYFRVLAQVLRNSDEKGNKKNKIFIDIIPRPGSSNNGEPILDLILFEDKEIDKSLIIFKGKKPKDFNYFNIGIQVQGLKVKLFIASKYYDNVSVNESDEYLQEFNKLVPFSEIEKISKLGPLKLSKQRGKTFLNYNFSLTKENSFSEMHDLLYDLSKCFSESLNLKN